MFRVFAKLGTNITRTIGSSSCVVEFVWERAPMEMPSAPTVHASLTASMSPRTQGLQMQKLPCGKKRTPFMGYFSSHEHYSRRIEESKNPSRFRFPRSARANRFPREDRNFGVCKSREEVHLLVPLQRVTTTHYGTSTITPACVAQQATKHLFAGCKLAFRPTGYLLLLPLLRLGTS